MKIILDLHIHSKYSRACSKDLEPKNLEIWAKIKGISVLSTGDFTHPGWLKMLEENLEEAEFGLFKIKNSSTNIRFLLGAELASIYKQGDKVCRVHNLVFAPSFVIAKKFIKKLEDRGVNLKSDGRPIMGVPCDELLKICKDSDASMQLIPAHAWTPHFGVFGSLSGFDNLEEAFGNLSSEIKAIETGLSSDPLMNWQIPFLDNIALVSNSDAHSLRKLGREANVLEIAEMSYKNIFDAIYSQDKNKFLYTIEFFPEEGKYHLDGHRDCQFSCTPDKTRKLGGLCPVCGKKLLRGVMSRVADLGSRDLGFVPANAIPFKSIVPLEEVIADTYGVGVTSKKVAAAYNTLTKRHSEFEILLDLPEEELVKITEQNIAQSILRVREGKVVLKGGYDGEFGKIQIYSAEERSSMNLKPKQQSLF